MNIALIAHDKKKNDIIELSKKYKAVILATGKTDIVTNSEKIV